MLPSKLGLRNGIDLELYGSQGLNPHGFGVQNVGTRLVPTKPTCLHFETLGQPAPNVHEYLPNNGRLHYMLLVILQPKFRIVGLGSFGTFFCGMRRAAWCFIHFHTKIRVPKFRESAESSALCPMIV